MAARKKSTTAPVFHREDPMTRIFNGMSEEALTVINNVLTTRKDFMKRFLDPKKDINKECDYPETGEITAANLRDLYDRENISCRVVQLMPKEAWQSPPTIIEDDDPEVTTPFETAFEEVGQTLGGQSWYKDSDRNPIWEPLKRANELSRIGRYGLMLLIIDDNQSWATPAAGVMLSTNGKAKEIPVTDTSKLKEGTLQGTDAQYFNPGGSTDVKPVAKPTKTVRLLGIRSVDESMVQIVQYESNIASPRFSMPIRYLVTLNDPRQVITGVGLSITQFYVHWTRVIHIADNGGSSPVLGVPAMQPVLNRLLDLRKLYAGSAEMYWKGAFPGISLESNPALGTDATFDTDAVREDMASYMNGLQRYLTLIGMSAKTLAPTVVDPTPQINANIQGVCIQLGCPMRVFMGSERGELASSQDDSSWNDRLGSYQNEFITPRIICPTIDRLIQMNVLPEPKQYKAVWPDLNSMTDQDKATVGLTRTQAIASYIGGNGEALIQPTDYLVQILGIDQEVAMSMIESTMEAGDEEDRLTPDPNAPPEGEVDENGDPIDHNDPNAPAPDAQEGDEEAITNKKKGKSALGEFLRNTAISAKGEARDSHGRWTSGLGARPSPVIDKSAPGQTALKPVKTLGGSTGAKQVQDDAGKQFVLKKGNSKEHLQSEYHAEKMYAAMGVKFPGSRMLNKDSETPHKLSNFIEGGKTLASAKGIELDSAVKQLQRNFAAHALMANWDVIGMSKDNVMLHKGTVVHIDAGGALDYRAQGAKKGAKWNGKVDEFHSMRNASINKSAADIFGGMSDRQLKNSIDRVLKHKDAVMAVTPEHLKDMMEKRFASLKKHGEGLEVSAPGKEIELKGVTAIKLQDLIKPTQVSNPHSSLGSNDTLVSHLQKSSGNVFTKNHLDKFQAINPHGIQNNTIHVPLIIANDAKKLAHLQSILPSGTLIKKVNAAKLMAQSKATGAYENMKAVPSGKEPGKPTGLKKADKTPPGLIVPGADQSHVALTGTAPALAENQAVKEWKNGLTLTEKSAIQSWKGSAHGIRKAIAENPPPPPPAAIAAAFYTGIAKAPRYEGTVYRGVSGSYAATQMDIIKAAGVGGTWSDAAPMCMSRGVGTSASFSGGQLLFKIKTKTGRCIEQVGGFGGEKEVCAMPGVQHKIVAIHESHMVGTKKVKMLVEMEEV